MFLYMNQWSSGTITGYDLADLGSIPGKVRFLHFQIFVTCSGVYIDKFGLKYHNRRGLVGVGVGLMTMRFSV